MPSALLRWHCGRGCGERASCEMRVTQSHEFLGRLIIMNMPQPLLKFSFIRPPIRGIFCYDYPSSLVLWEGL